MEVTAILGSFHRIRQQFRKHKLKNPYRALIYKGLWFKLVDLSSKSSNFLAKDIDRICEFWIINLSNLLWSHTNICISKISKSENFIWRKDFSIGFVCGVSAIAENDNNELFVCGRFKDIVYHDHDMILTKTSSSGLFFWFMVIYFTVKK